MAVELRVLLIGGTKEIAVAPVANQQVVDKQLYPAMHDVTVAPMATLQAIGSRLRSLPSPGRRAQVLAQRSRLDIGITQPWREVR